MCDVTRESGAVRANGGWLQRVVSRFHFCLRFLRHSMSCIDIVTAANAFRNKKVPADLNRLVSPKMYGEENHPI